MCKFANLVKDEEDKPLCKFAHHPLQANNKQTCMKKLVVLD